MLGLRKRLERNGMETRMVHSVGQRRISWLFRGGPFLVAALLAVIPQHAALARPLKLIALGDSLTAGLGLAPADSFPSQLERALRAKGHDVEVLNAGVSGDTIANGLERFDWSVPGDADAAIVELGANDTLRGIDAGLSRGLMDKLLARFQARKIPVLIAGMKALTNCGSAYSSAFEAMYVDLAKKYAAPLYPFFLNGVALSPALNQADGLHPTAKGVAVIVERILPAVEDLLAKLPPKA